MSDSRAFFAGLADGLRSSAEYDWPSIARPNQLPPPGDWRVWLLLAGRGFGKTRVVCEFVRSEVERGAARRVALLSPTAADARDVIVEGESGLLAISPPWNKPTYEASKRRLTWKSGAIATLYSADEPERLRGPQHDLAVCDELAAWRYPEAFDQLLLGLRLGKNPRVAIATTPRPTRIIRELLAREGKDVAVTRGSTLENSANLAAAYIEQIVTRYKGTRLERQEIFGEVLDDTPGALWNRDNLEQTRVAEAPPLQRVVVAIDPAGSTEETADITGIVVAGLGQDGHGYVLEDLSGRYAPTEWARRALGAYHVWKADRIVCERNYGGQMCLATIAAVDPTVPVKEITSSRGKVLRAEPISSLFEQRRAHMVGSLPEVEDQACRFTSDWTRARDGSPDRVDAMVFALTELMLGAPVGGFFREASLLVNGEPVGVPYRPTGLLAVIGTASKIAPECDGVGVLYFAYLARSRNDYPCQLALVDWSLEPFENVDALRGVWERLETLRRECEAHTHEGGIWIESTAIGSALLHHGQASGLDVHEMIPEMLPADLPGRAARVSGYVGSGAVKIARAAYEKLTTYRGVTKNHALAQILSFGVTAEQAEAAELLHALCVGIVLCLDEKPPLSQI